MQVERLVSQTVAQFGRLDVMVANSGGALITGVAPERHTFKQWRAVVALNLDSVFLCCTAAARQMIKQGEQGGGGGGRIISISSMAGRQGQAGSTGGCEGI